MPSQIHYNGIDLFNVYTRRFEQEAVYDDSHTDLLFYKYVVSCVAYVHAASVSGADVYPHTYPRIENADTGSGQKSFAGGAARNLDYIRSSLMKPRGVFRMWAGVTSRKSPNDSSADAKLLLRADPAGSLNQDKKSTDNIDLDNGPKPKIVRVGNITDDNMIRVEFEIEICKLDCPRSGSDTGNTSGVLSNRWTCTDDIDQQFYTTRTFQGRLRATASNLNPHAFRNLVVNPLEDGFRRDKMTFVSSADGLTLDYTIIDKQVAFAAPKPATKWELRHRITTGNGLITQSAVSVRLEGPWGTDKKRLLQIAFRLIEIKGIQQYALNLGIRQENYVVRELIVDDVYSESESSVAVSAVIQAVGSSVQQAPSWQTLQRFGNVLGRPVDGSELSGYDNFISIDMKEISPEFGATGTAGMAGAMSVYLQTPCSNVHAFQYGIKAAPESSWPDAPDEERPGYPQNTPLSDDGFSTEHKTNFYTVYKAESKYITAGYKIQLPTAGGTPIGGSNAKPATAAVITVARPKASRIIRVHAERVGNWPTMPTADTFVDPGTGIIYTIIDTHVMPTSAVPAADGQLIYKADVEYEFAMSRPLTIDETMRAVQPPWLQAGFIPGVGAVPVVNLRGFTP